MATNKLGYYLSNALFSLVPASLLRARLKNTLESACDYDQKYISERVGYYNKLADTFTPDDKSGTTVGAFKKTGGNTYFFDLYRVVKYLDTHLQFDYVNGDVTEIPQQPAFLKSRPIEGDNQNSVLLKLNAVRHYQFVDDKIPYKNKKDMVVWRGAGFRKNRKDLVKGFFDHPRCDIARVDKHFMGKDTELKPEHLADKMTIEEQLNYKFILSIEGKDVATNLKWIMSSNSLCFTPKLKYETWFMEGRLKAGIHYVEVKDDYSDLIEKMDYYLEHEDEALQIIKNANDWVEQFKDKKREKLISLLVAQKYFKTSGQL